MPAGTAQSADELVLLLAVTVLIALQGNDHHIKVSAERRMFAAPAASTPKSNFKKRAGLFFCHHPSCAVNSAHEGTLNNSFLPCAKPKAKESVIDTGR